MEMQQNKNNNNTNDGFSHLGTCRVIIVMPYFTEENRVLMKIMV
jgi:hypothetical protein